MNIYLQKTIERKNLFVVGLGIFVFVFISLFSHDVNAQRGSGGRGRITPTPQVTPTPVPPPTGSSIDDYMDIDNDGVVDIYDYAVIAGEYGWSGPMGGNPADFNSDGDVDETDLNLITSSFGEIPGPLWVTEQSAQSYCQNGEVFISVSFSNEETQSDLSMAVLATDTQTSATIDLGVIEPQGVGNGVINTGGSSLEAGVVVFDLSWVNGDPRKDKRYVSYEAVSCGVTATPTPFVSPTPTATPAEQCATDYTVHTFDSIPGDSNSEGTRLNNQFEGISFELTNCSIQNPQLVVSGSPLTGFILSPDFSSDTPAVGETFGPRFITDSGYPDREDICTLVVIYEPGYRTRAVQFDLVDVDGATLFSGDIAVSYYESFTATAYNESGDVLVQESVLSNTDEYDGRAFTISLISETDDIAWVEIEGTSNK